MDFSIYDNGNSFFTVAIVGEDGNIIDAYTRDGAFRLIAITCLLPKDGWVMGQEGPIIIYDKGFV